MARGIIIWFNPDIQNSALWLNLVLSFADTVIITLTHWGRVTQICVSKLTIINSDKALSSGRRQAIIWTSAGILLIRSPGININDIVIKIRGFSLYTLWSMQHLLLNNQWRQWSSDRIINLQALTHWGRDKMDAISQTTFSCSFSSMKIAVFWLNFHWNVFARVQLTIIQHWLR